MARGKAHSEETRATVMAALLAGQGVTEIARQYQVPKATISRIKNEVLPDELEQVGTEKRARVENLLFSYLTRNLEALGNQCEVAGREAYINQQSGSDLATLHGVMADKAIRLLEAAALASEDTEP